LRCVPVSSHVDVLSHFSVRARSHVIMARRKLSIDGVRLRLLRRISSTRPSKFGPMPPCPRWLPSEGRHVPPTKISIFLLKRLMSSTRVVLAPRAPSMMRGQAAQLAAAHRRCASSCATLPAAKNRSALSTPVPCDLDTSIFDGSTLSLCRSSCRTRRCSLQLQLQPRGKRMRRPWMCGFRLPKRLPALWAGPLDPVGADLWHRPTLLPVVGVAARSSWAAAKVRRGWRAATGRSGGRGLCGWFPHTSAPARAHAAAVGAATRVDKAEGALVH